MTVPNTFATQTGPIPLVQIDQNFAALGNSSNISFIQSGTGAVARTAQSKMRDTVSVKDFGAVGDGVTNDSVAIQTAINAVNSAGGGIVYLPTGTYNLGTTGLTVYQNIKLCGEVNAYINSTRGTLLTYSGTGWVISGSSLLNTSIQDLSIDASSATGASVIGIYFNGAWLCTVRGVRIKGVTRSKGYGILVATNTAAGPWGAQHNLFEMIECADGVIRMAGPTAVDGVTTTVMNTIRGLQYEFQNFQGALINTTAETWTTGAGFSFDGTGTFVTMVGCDIEGSGSPGISIGTVGEVREIGTIWAGFSGALRVSGNMATLRSYGGALQWISALSAASAAKIAGWQDYNAEYLADYIYPENVTGGSQSGYRYWQRRINGTMLTDHNFRQHGFVEKAISTAATSAATIFTIPVPNGFGLRLSAHASGIQTGDNYYSNSRDCVVMNAGGTLTITQETQLTAGAPCAISFTASGSNVLVQWTPTTANASTGTMNLEIRGPWTSYT